MHGAQLLSVKRDSRPAAKPVSGTQTSGMLEKLKALLHKDMIQFMKHSIKYLQERLPLKNMFLFSVQCSKLSMRRNPDSIQMMKQLAASVPQVACEMNFLDSVSTEWRLYQADADIPAEWAETLNGHGALVDEYCTGHG